MMQANSCPPAFRYSNLFKEDRLSHLIHYSGARHFGPFHTYSAFQSSVFQRSASGWAAVLHYGFQHSGLHSSTRHKVPLMPKKNLIIFQCKTPALPSVVWVNGSGIWKNALCCLTCMTKQTHCFILVNEIYKSICTKLKDVVYLFICVGFL